MKIKCDKIVSCGHYECVFNHGGTCLHDVVSINASGQCALCKLKPVPKDNGGKPAQNKSNTPFDIEASE